MYPSLLKKNPKKKKGKSNSSKEEKKPEVIDNDKDNIYPSVEQLRQEKIEGINNTSISFWAIYEICMIGLLIIFILNVIYGIKEQKHSK